MNKTMFPILFLAAWLMPTLIQAELVFYQGANVLTYITEGHTLTVNWKTIVVVDHDTAEVGQISYATIYGAKHYYSTTLTNTHFVEVAGKTGNYTVIARMRTPCETDCGLTGEGVYFKGLNASLTLNTNSTVTFPRSLNTRGVGLAYSQNTGQPILDDGSVLVTFDQRATLASNQSEEPFDAAIARLIDHFEAQGYTR